MEQNFLNCVPWDTVAKRLIRSSSLPPTQFHGQIILRKIKQSSSCDSRILRTLIVLTCPEIFWEGQVAVFKLAPNLFLKGNCRASCAQYNEQKDLGIVALNPWPRPKSTIWGPPLWFHCVMTVPRHEISPIKYRNVRMIDKKFKIKSDQLKDIPVTPSLPFIHISVLLLLRWQAGSIGRLTGFAARVWSCSVCGKWPYVRAGPDYSSPFCACRWCPGPCISLTASIVTLEFSGYSCSKAL